MNFKHVLNGQNHALVGPKFALLGLRHNGHIDTTIVPSTTTSMMQE